MSKSGNAGKEEEPKYGIFNGRRNADQYVKGWFKACTGIATATLVLGSAFGGCLQ